MPRRATAPSLLSDGSRRSTNAADHASLDAIVSARSGRVAERVATMAASASFNSGGTPHPSRPAVTSARPTNATRSATPKGPGTSVTATTPWVVAPGNPLASNRRDGPNTASATGAKGLPGSERRDATVAGTPVARQTPGATARRGRTGILRERTRLKFSATVSDKSDSAHRRHADGAGKGRHVARVLRHPRRSAHRGESDEDLAFGQRVTECKERRA